MSGTSLLDVRDLRVWYSGPGAPVQAVDALSRIAPDTPSAGRAVGALLPGLRAESPSSRIRAVEALTRFAPGSADAVDGIRSLKDDPDDRVRKAAANALDAIEMAAAP